MKDWYIQAIQKMKYIGSRSAGMGRRDEDIRAFLKEFNMLIAGEKLNKVYANELYHRLFTLGIVSIGREDFLLEVPSLAAAAGMKAEAMYNVSALPKRVIGDYQISLFE